MVARQLLSFTLVGVLGFVVDALALYMAMGLLGAGLYSGRLISYLTAATTTWALNRGYTFRSRRSQHRFAEWVRFLSANALGGLVNYGTYAFLITTYPFAATHPVLGVAAGSLAGLVINFSLSRAVVFRGTGPDV